MKNIKVKSFFYEEGSFSISQGHKASEKKYKKDGINITPTGFGWATESEASKIILEVEGYKQGPSLRVDMYIRDEWPRLTKKRIQALEATCPNELVIDDNDEVSFKSIEDWMKMAKKVMNK